MTRRSDPRATRRSSSGATPRAGRAVALVLAALVLLPVIDATHTAVWTSMTLPATTVRTDVTLNPAGDILVAPVSSSSSAPLVLTRSGTTWTAVASPFDVVPNGQINHAEWNPAGTHVAFAGTASPYLFVYEHVGGGSFVKLANPATLPMGGLEELDWNDAGTHIAVVSTTSPYVRVYEAPTLVALATFTGAPAGGGLSVDWSSDGKLAVGHQTSPSLTVYTSPLTPATPGKTTPGTPPPSSGRGVAWNSDASRLAVAHAGSGCASITIYDAALAVQADPTNCFTGGHMVSYSPDDAYLMFSADSGLIAYHDTGGGSYTSFSLPATLANPNGLSWATNGCYFGASSGTSPYLRVYSLDACASPIDPPGSPSAQIDRSFRALDLSWTAPADDGGAAITSYKIYRAIPSSGSTSLLVTLSASNLTFQDATVGALICDAGGGPMAGYEVSAVNAAGEGPRSELVFEAPLCVGAGGPVLSARGFRETAYLSWNAGGWTNPISFGLYRGYGPDNLTLFATLAGTNRTYNDRMQPGDAWYYAVRVANATDTSLNSNVVHVEYTPPPPPLYGDEGTIWGPSGKAGFAAQMRVSVTAAGIFYGLFYLIGLTAFGYGVGTKYGRAGPLMAAVGAGCGLAVSMVLGFFPVWLVAIVAVPCIALFLLIRRASASRGGY